MVREQLAEVDGLLDSLHGADRFELADEQVLEAVYRLKHRLDALVATTSAVVKDSGMWQRARAKSAPAYIAWRCHVPLQMARAMTKAGKKLVSMPYVAQAYANGEITADHVALFERVHNRATATPLPMTRRSWSTTPRSTASRRSSATWA